MKIKYPDPSINIEKPNASSSKGMLFENSLNISNEYYLVHNIAMIYKKPTPIQIVKVDYPSRSKAKITEAYYKIPSTTDYNGLYKGKYIDFEAKETNNLSFDFKHIFEHQINHLVKVKENGGISFLIIYYKKVNEIYIIPIDEFNKLYLNSKNGERKSITVDTAKQIGYEVKRGYTPPIDYLKIIDQYFLD